MGTVTSYWVLSAEKETQNLQVFEAGNAIIPAHPVQKGENTIIYFERSDADHRKKSHPSQRPVRQARRLQPQAQ